MWILALVWVQFPQSIASQQIPAQQVVSASADPVSADRSSEVMPSIPASPQQTDEILRVLAEMRDELKESRQEVADLRREVSKLREELASGNAGGAGNLQEAVDRLKDDQEVIQSQVKTLEQTKVATESRYPLRLSGMVLLNSFVVDGAVDNPALPLIALPRTPQWVHHSMGGTLEQTQLGLSATGPKLWNERTSAEISTDFFSSSYTSIPPPTGMNLRLRTASAYLDWKNAQVSFGQQTPLITPLSPTSFATLGSPALAWAGNLWTWLPQATFMQRKTTGDSSHAVFAVGILDPEAGAVTGEQAYGVTSRNLQPGYEGRIAYEWGDPSRPYELAANGYYTRQLYYGSGTVENQALDFWAATADWHVPIAKIAELSGEFYRGRGIGDLGGGAFKNTVVEYGAQYASGLNATGGWVQWKSRLTPSLEVNAYFGADSAQADQVRNQMPAASTTPYFYLIKNQSAAANIIYRPKTYLVFSGEYRYLKSWYTFAPGQEAQTLDLTMGYVF
jgi:chaperonin cofactor prefoldin